MTLDEAIEMQKRFAEEVKTKGKTWDKEYSKQCKKWANEHEQLAEWLE